MDDIYKKLEKNYFEEVKKYLEFLKTKGYVLTPTSEGDQIWKYNARLNDFYKAYSIKDIIQDIHEKSPNYFDIVMTDSDYIPLIEEVLPKVTIDDIDLFRKYNEATRKIKDQKDIEKDNTEIIKYVEGEKKPISKTAPDDVNEQIQALINNGVVFCQYSDGSSLKKNGLFRYDKKEKEWEILTNTSICQILENVFEKDFDPQTIKYNYKKIYRGVPSSAVPYQYNRQKEYREIIKNFNNPILDGSQWR